LKTKTVITVAKFNNNYNRQAYKIGTRITRGQVGHKVGYLDPKTNMMFHSTIYDYDAWIWLVNKTKDILGLSPQNAAKYVNSIYQSKLKTGKEDFSHLNKYILMLRDTCGKWFSVVPTMQKV
jgi:hypothetical protein